MQTIVLKEPTLQTIQECELLKGCLIPMNEGGFLCCNELQNIINQFVLTPEEVKREEEIKDALDFGFPPKIIEIPIVQEDILKSCYNLILTGHALVNVFDSLICPYSCGSSKSSEELELYQELQNIYIKRKYLKEFTSGSILERFFYYFLLQKSLMKKDFSLVFETINDLYNCEIDVLTIFMSRFIEFRNYIPKEVFKAIARGDGETGAEWLSVWYGAKVNNVSIFENWDLNKLELCRWTQRYDSIRSGYEAPSENIIANDSKLEHWLYQKKLESKKGGTTPTGNNGLYFENSNAEISTVAPNAMTFIAGEDDG